VHSADKVLAEYPVGSFDSPSSAWTKVQDDSTSAIRQGLFDDLSKFVPTYAYEFAESDTPQFTSIYLLQQKNEVARNFPFGATHVDDLGRLWDYLGQTLPYSDDQLELSNQMIRYWGNFVATGNPNGSHTPSWAKYQAGSGVLMSLSACDTPPASTRPPAACSAATNGFAQEHNTTFWDSFTT
jgi:para-nitrobenzyl esterase